MSTNSLLPTHYVDGFMSRHHFLKESHLFYIFIGERAIIWLLCSPFLSVKDLPCGSSVLLK